MLDKGILSLLTVSIDEEVRTWVECYPVNVSRQPERRRCSLL